MFKGVFRRVGERCGCLGLWCVVKDTRLRNEEV